MHPFSFSLKGRKILFIGGGKVAERKITAISCEGCAITVVAPEVTGNIKQLCEEIILREFDENDITGDYFMIFCCTDDRQVNKKAGELAKQHNILVNIADAPNESDFHTASIIRSGDYVISISTEGKNPSKSKKMREKLITFLKNL